MATATQKRVKAELIKMVENGSRPIISKAMVAAGMSPNTAKAPSKLTRSKGWKEITENDKEWRALLEKNISDSKLIKVLNEGLEAGKTVYKNNNESGKIEEVGYEPDFQTRHKYLVTGLQLKDRLKEKPTSTTSFESLPQVEEMVFNVLNVYVNDGNENSPGHIEVGE